MAEAAVIGEALEVEGYALAGVTVYPAASENEATAAWAALSAGTVLLILTANAARWLADLLPQRPEVLTAVMLT